LLTVGHSYVVRTNRRLADALQHVGNGEWDVTVAAPSLYKGSPRYGDFQPSKLIVGDDETVKVVGIPVALSNRVHIALYGRQLHKLMSAGFDAVLSWEEPFILPGAQIVRWAPRNAVVTVLTYQNIKKSYPPPFNWLERATMARADGWVAAATLVEETLEDRPMYAARPHRVLGPGVDTNQFRPDAAARARIRAMLGWADNGAPVVGYLGRITEAKGVPLLTRALDGIQHPWRALFVGSGSAETELRRWATRYGANVQILSVVGHEEVPEYLNAMDILCVPSQTTPIWREQFGRVLIEAFACGVCVVASDSGEIPHVVDDAGCIVGERDEVGWRREIAALIENAERRKDLAERGLARVAAHYTWSVIGTRYLEFFDDLSRSKHRRSA
jgi:glycosyltransferase involved in cell wall biosynthesis